jgi:type IV pilus assembly protein PilV
MTRFTRRIPRMKQVLDRQSGVMLVEVMLTVVVLSVGLLGLGALQIQNKQSNLIAAQRSFASHLAHDLFERVRSNAIGVDTFLVSDSALILDGDSLSQPSPLCTSGAECDPVQLAAHDLWQWERILAGEMTLIDDAPAGVLLSPTACLGRPAGGGSGTYSLAIAWRSSKAVDNPVTGNDVADTCGTATGRYDRDAPGDNKMRHVLFIESYVITG